jgi:type IV secretory pathway VirB3-like protein
MASPYASSNPIRKILGVFIWPQTYLNTLYLLLAFPLGIAYFVILVTGLSVGVGTLVIWVGAPILLLVFLVSYLLTWLERQLTVRLLHQNIPARAPRRNDQNVTEDLTGGNPDLSGEERIFLRVWRKLKSHFTRPATWTGVIYLLAKFPIGIAAFVAIVVSLSVSFYLIIAPIIYRYWWFGPQNEWWQVNIAWRFHSFNEAMILAAIGLALLLLSVHVLNLAAFLVGRFARLMLGLELTEPVETTGTA